MTGARRWSPATLLAIVVAAASPLSAQGRGGPTGATARSAAPIDLTGYWVAYISEDWRYRMVTPPKGDYRGVPITKAALQVINAWDPAADEAAGNACKSYGAGAVMRLPGRIHIRWQDDVTLRVDTDAGMQTRLLRFAPGLAPSGESTWQGRSVAQWERPGGRGAAASPQTGSLTVVTTRMRAGYLRKNGVPYSENATVTEYFDLAPHPGDGRLLVVTTVVEDPLYLSQPFIVSSHFKKEADGSRWDPTPCSATW